MPNSREPDVASGVFSTSRYLGSIVGSSLLAGLLGSPSDGVAGFGVVFLMAVAAALLSALASVGLQATNPDYSRRIREKSGLT